MACCRLWPWLITAAIHFCMLAVVVSTEVAADEKARATTGPQAVPPDYREIIARSILTKTDRDKIRRAEISRPALSFGREALRRPVACVRLIIQGTKGERELNAGFTFEVGQIDEVFNPDETDPKVGVADAAVIKYGYKCDSLSYYPFPELLKSTR